LKAVLAHYQLSFPILTHQFFAQGDFPHIRFLREAALLWNKLYKDDMFAGIHDNGTLSILFLEKGYLSDLNKDWQRQKILDKLFFRKSEDIYFNGLALKGAAGKTFEELVNNPALESVSEYKQLLSSERIALLTDKFKQMGESLQYPVGSLYHSLASVSIRILYYQQSIFPKLFESQADLIERFKQIEAVWELKKNYPVQPRVLVALHLAESNNVKIAGTNWQEKVSFLLRYLANEVEKLFLAPPHFDRSKAAEKILHEDMGLSFGEIHKKRYYVIGGDNFNLAQTYFGSPLEQFLALTDWDGKIGSKMYTHGKTIEPRAELQKAEETFNDNLYHHSWVKNKAEFNTNGSTVEVEQEVKRIAENYVVETEKHRALVRGFKIWINTVPIVGPLYNIEEGVRNKDPMEIICGIFFLSLDCLDLLSGGTTEEVPAHGATVQKNLPLRERITIETLNPTFEELNISVEDLPLDDRILEKPTSQSTQDREIPADFVFITHQVRLGVHGLKWNDFELVYLKEEDRVVPVRSLGGYFREASWKSGEIDYTKHPIFQDPITKNYYSFDGLKGGGLAYDIDLKEADLLKRNTIEQTLNVLDQANDFTQRSFTDLFNQHFSISVQEPTSSFSAFAFYEKVYNLSPTFRRIFNRFHDTAAHVVGIIEEPWRIEIKHGAISRTDFSSRTIHIASDTEIEQSYYIAINNKLAASQKEQIYLHEILHALTGRFDPQKTLSYRNRGVIVYLTDKILNEVGYVFPERLIYKRPSFIQSNAENTKTLDVFVQDPQEIVNLVTQENLFLDQYIDSRIPVTEYKKVFGEDLISRYTISEVNAIWDKLAKLPNKPGLQFSFYERTEMLFVASDSDTFHALQGFYEKLYEKSNTFLKLFDAAWFQQIGKELRKPWYFEVDNEAALMELPANKKVHCINDLTRKVYIFDDGTLYLSNKGLIPVERSRQLVQLMVQILTGVSDLPAALAFSNRGAVVQLSDKILAETKLYFPKQIAYRLAMPEDLETQNLLLKNQLQAARAAFLEDNVIKQIKEHMYKCSPFCKMKRSTEGNLKRTFKNKGLFTSQPKQKQELKQIMTAIKNKLQVYNIDREITPMQNLSEFLIGTYLNPNLFFTPKNAFNAIDNAAGHLISNSTLR
jgi:hypothetical protein